MIAKFNSAAGRSALIAGALIILVGGLAFTRAAGPARTEPALMPPAAVATADSSAPATAEAAPARQQDAAQSSVLLKRLHELKSRIDRQQRRVDDLRRDLGRIDEGQDAPLPGADTIHFTEREQIKAEAAAARYQTLYKELRGKDRAQLAQSIPTAVGDTELAQLLRDLNSSETQFAKLSQDYGPDNAVVKQVAAMLKTVSKQIDARIEGILAGLEVQAFAQTASAAACSNWVQTAKADEAKLSEKYRPYLAAKLELDRLRSLHDALLLKVWTTAHGAEASDLP